MCWTLKLSAEIKKNENRIEEDIFLLVSSFPGHVSPLCLASPAASALFLLVLFCAEPPIPPLLSSENI